MSEDFIYDQGDVKVSSARFVVGGQTYPMEQISSVKVEAINQSGCVSLFSLWVYANMVAGVFIVLYGLWWAISGDGEDVSGVVFGVPLTMGILYLVQRMVIKAAKKSYFVTITTAAGETRALQNTDREMIEIIVDALNQALVQRG